VIPVAIREDLRRYTAAVLRANAIYRNEQEAQRARVDRVRVCAARDCTTTTRSEAGRCPTHRSDR